MATTTKLGGHGDGVVTRCSGDLTLVRTWLRRGGEGSDEAATATTRRRRRRRRLLGLRRRKGGSRLSFAYQLLYLLDATGFYTPGLHVLEVHVCRATGQELVCLNEDSNGDGDDYL
ncbi:uncharacterized protein A4U43_C04F7480 [Asparagus officinalis]|uniref:Uncharacterized protein n=1 Tax=Asparagus officinalis TaxID=4686 RepID=A0A5P1F3Y0_ASPOF|nr:uncharacterized protein A4U43_C04F7480 [Asparagus officinalis]